MNSVEVEDDTANQRDSIVDIGKRAKKKGKNGGKGKGKKQAWSIKKAEKPIQIQT